MLRPRTIAIHFRNGPKRARAVRRTSHLAALVARATIALSVLVTGLRIARADEPRSDRFLSSPRQLTFEGRRAGEGYFSSDGTKLVFQSEREPGNPFYQIYLLDLETGDVERVSPGVGKTTCAWVHPKGARVLFASTHADPGAADKAKRELEERASGTKRRYAWDYDESYEIYDVEIASKREVRLTTARGYDAEGSWSPDGNLIAFSSNRHAYEGDLSNDERERLTIDPSYFLDIYIMNADGSDVRRLTEVPGYDGGPFFSPDGKRLCWRRFTPDGTIAEIHTMRIDGSDVRRLTNLGAMSWAPFWHPSSEYLIFTTNRHGFENFELYIVDGAGAHEPVRVTATPGFDGLPVFHPTGVKLAWTTNRTASKDSQIFLADWDHDAALEAIRGSRAASTTVPVAKSKKGPTQPEISVADLEARVTILASEAMEGRLTGTEGERLATEYVASAFAEAGLEPAGDDGTYFQTFEFTAGVALGRDNALAISTGDPGTAMALTVDQDWRPLAFSSSGKFEPSSVVFAGYGIVAPKSEAFSEYDSYVHLDVKDKWVLMLRFLPERITPEHRQHLARYSSLRYKAMSARDRGARGILIASGPTSKVKEQLIALRFDAALAGAGLAAVSITDDVAAKITSAAGKDFGALVEELDAGEPTFGFAIEGIQLGGEVALDSIEKRGRNVLARLPSGVAEARPVVVVGAHVDHLGRGTGGSLARDEEKGEIHFGADDNASGVATIIEVAEHLAERQKAGALRLERDILFAAWSGEELGLIGSRHFIDIAKPHPHAVDLGDLFAAYVNLDMVGRLDKELILNGVASSWIWRREIERRNAPIGLALALSDDTYLPTDATSFYLAGVPILSAFTGSHAEYHTPRDTPDTLSYAGMERVGRFIALIVRGLATSQEAPDFIKVAAPDRPGARAGLRAWLGTIPDYKEPPIPGLALSGVAKDGPADKAGMKGGDIIIELAGRKIANIYDYTFAIDALKIGEAVKVAVQREGERVELEITPASRE
jgi:Tol biopolymer transport system component